ncbi:GAF sensor signal transduction histidine kinase [Halorubrum coriense DSM 10284]|uniref:histidine kinase n=2 Tax=Halorubrum coriense TaxID=64713 RepID=M0ECM5_9EURY|nr:GAF sensor signal transduction histidine kinase [Halorubrum coriense DSM 10284]
MPLSEKIAKAVTLGRERLDLAYGVLSYTADGEHEITGSTVRAGEFAAGTVSDLEETWCRHVVDERELLVVADAGASTYADDVARKASGWECYIGGPIVVDGETYGTLCYSDETPRDREFRETERRFVQLMTQWISYEIEREKHYQTVEAQNERLDEFAGVLAHDIRNPLTAAVGYTEYAIETAPDTVTTRLRTVMDSLDRIEELIASTLALAREGVDVGERDRVDLGRVAREAWDLVAPSNAALEVAESRALTADESRLRQLFENVFRNVDEHCGTGVTVTVRGTDSGFAIANDGPEMPAEIADSLFDDAFGADRGGLGLLIVERVVSGHGWDGAVETGPDETEFVFSGVGTATTAPRPA